MPAVSIILPTFNRERFLPEALASIERQSFSDWELIIVDDGSTDGTRALVERHQHGPKRPHYTYQPNRGAYGARNTGLDLATGRYIAFFDSDDLWLPGYLERAVTALDAHPDLDWVYLACRRVDDATGDTLSESTFYENGVALPFLAAPSTDGQGGVKLLAPQSALTSQVTTGLYAGLQNSVIRRRVFEGQRFWEDYRVIEDVLFLIRALSRGVRVGYIDEVHVAYRVHGDNSSAASTESSAERLIPIYEEEIRGLDRVQAEADLPDDTRELIRKKLSTKYLWRLGYAGLWRAGRRDEALRAFKAGLAINRADWRMWKTYALCRLRYLTGS